MVAGGDGIEVSAAGDAIVGGSDGSGCDDDEAVSVPYPAGDGGGGGAAELADG